MRSYSMAAVLVLPFMLSWSGMVSADSSRQAKQLERGRYVLSISGCNDCHTPEYPETGGKIPPQDWLTGSSVGFSGPWGTTYPSNLRLLIASMSEQTWLQRARQEMRPPMPWFSLRDMSDADLKAIYAYIRSLGPKGEATPAYVPPGQKVSTPYFYFVPQNLPGQQAGK